jgi:hypothetical protein
LDPSLTLAVASVSVPGGPTGSGRNFPRLEDRAVDKACEAADSAIDATGRAVASQVLHARLLGLHAVKPLYFARDGWAVSKRIALPRADDRRIKRTIQYWANTLGLKSDHSEEPSR